LRTAFRVWIDVIYGSWKRHGGSQLDIVTGVSLDGALVFDAFKLYFSADISEILND
jgi:hypothetical protein